MDTLTVGTLVTIKPEWQDSPETIKYLVREVNGNRVFISPINCDWSLVPIELVRDYMLAIVTG